MTSCKAQTVARHGPHTCSRPATKDGYCTRHHPSYTSPATKAAIERLDKLKTYTVRITRSTDHETADIKVRAEDVDEAKKLAVREAELDEHMYFPRNPEPFFYIDPMDEPDEPDDELGD